MDAKSTNETNKEPDPVVKKKRVFKSPLLEGIFTKSQVLDINLKRGITIRDSLFPQDTITVILNPANNSLIELWMEEEGAHTRIYFDVPSAQMLIHLIGTAIEHGKEQSSKEGR